VVGSAEESESEEGRAMMSDDDAKKWHAQTWPMMRKIILDHIAEIDAGKITPRAALVCIVSEKHTAAGGFRVCLCGLLPDGDETTKEAGRHLTTTCVRVLDLMMRTIGNYGDDDS
jgi:hypothetical protein